MRTHDASEAELQAWLDDPCPPDVLGLNYYLTSERFLDEATGNYSPAHATDDGRYADTEAVRVGGGVALAGVTSLLLQAWQCYGRPVAITEAHLNCTRDEQVRWLHYVWESARAARAQGADVRAVTAWSLFGAFDWVSLLTRDAGHYETGVFDVRSGQPRPTLLAEWVRHLAQGRPFRHPVLQSMGWWQRTSRVLFQPSCAPDGLVGLKAAPPKARQMRSASRATQLALHYAA